MPFAYPVALELTGRRCLVVGTGAIAEAKARGLAEAGAAVTVVTPAPSAGLVHLERLGELLIERRAYRSGDLKDAFLAIVCDPALNAAVYAEAESRGVLCNAVDDIGHSHFAAPSVVRRGDLTLTVSTGGRSPALAKRLRRRLDEQFGADYATLVDLLSSARAEALARRTCDFGTWARRWEAILRAEDELLELVGAGRGAELVAWVVDQLEGGQPCDLKLWSTSPQVSGSVR